MKKLKGLQDFIAKPLKLVPVTGIIIDRRSKSEIFGNID